MKNMIHQLIFITCTIDSIIVIVLPVPGGPKTINGELPDDLLTILVTANFCSGFETI